VDAFPHTAGDEPGEQGDVGVGHVPVGYPAVAAVTDVVLGDQGVAGEVVLGAVGSGDRGVAPHVREGATVVGVDQVAVRRFERGEADVAPVHEPEHVCRHAGHVAGCLGWSQVATVGEHGEQVAGGRLVDLGV
jgi:hypothetical protein